VSFSTLGLKEKEQQFRILQEKLASKNIFAKMVTRVPSRYYRRNQPFFFFENLEKMSKNLVPFFFLKRGKVAARLGRKWYHLRLNV
jgi:hypothetical protein